MWHWFFQILGRSKNPMVWNLNLHVCDKICDKLNNYRIFLAYPLLPQRFFSSGTGNCGLVIFGSKASLFFYRNSTSLIHASDPKNSGSIRPNVFCMMHAGRKTFQSWCHTRFLSKVMGFRWPPNPNHRLSYWLIICRFPTKPQIWRDRTQRTSYLGFLAF